ncbi:MAG: RICIN domain-containing protein [Nostoc sp. DedQUE12b]|uniref:RICIN domain-containing protein n=1 Tax=Nostoc sp. DedQUE12b TaxID=3075398 RepID=UPI002AD3B5DE|nr:RICIN domain-containing protein [Nostoc sp. DedQUE12b]MDZ8084797.1 RICIN domain-containing protein [Nostoc sp. DedQUE12b]
MKLLKTLFSIGAISAISTGFLSSIVEVPSSAVYAFPKLQTIQTQALGTYVLKTYLNGRVLDFSNSAKQGEPVLLVNKHRGESQQWQLIRLENGYYIIKSIVNERVLDFRNAQNNKEPLVIANEHGKDNQQWELKQLSNGRYLIKSKLTGRVLDFRNNDNNREPVLLVDEHRGHSQQWILEKI